jgi:hypothetical protein
MCKTVMCEQWSAVPKTYRMTQCQLAHVVNCLEVLRKTSKQYWGNYGLYANTWLSKKYKGKFSGQRQTKNVYERSEKNGGGCVVRTSTLVMAL